MRDSLIGTISIAVSAGAAIVAFLLTPLLRFAEPRGLILTATTLGVGVGLTYIAHVRKWPEHVRLLSVVPIGIALGFVGDALAQVERSATANDRRCLAIQRDMLSARPLRDDDTALFQALGCQPQGLDSVHALPPTPSIRELTTLDQVKKR